MKTSSSLLPRRIGSRSGTVGQPNSSGPRRQLAMSLRRPDVARHLPTRGTTMAPNTSPPTPNLIMPRPDLLDSGDLVVCNLRIGDFLLHAASDELVSCLGKKFHCGRNPACIRLPPPRWPSGLHLSWLSAMAAASSTSAWCSRVEGAATYQSRTLCDWTAWCGWYHFWYPLEYWRSVSLENVWSRNDRCLPAKILMFLRPSI